MSETLRIELFPADLDVSVDYYVERLAFTITRDERPQGSRYVALVRGEVRLGLVEAGSLGRGAPRSGFDVEIVLEVDDLDAERARAESDGLTIDTDVTARPWGLRDFRVLDPDGYYWRVTEKEPAP